MIEKYIFYKASNNKIAQKKDTKPLDVLGPIFVPRIFIRYFFVPQFFVAHFFRIYFCRHSSVLSLYQAVNSFVHSFFSQGFLPMDNFPFLHFSSVHLFVYTDSRPCIFSIIHFCVCNARSSTIDRGQNDSLPCFSSTYFFTLILKRVFIGLK